MDLLQQGETWIERFIEDYEAEAEPPLAQAVAVAAMRALQKERAGKTLRQREDEARRLVEILKAYEGRLASLAILAGGTPKGAADGTGEGSLPA